MSEVETDGFSSRSSQSPLEVYNMKNRRRGLALIFNWIQFDPKLKMNPRYGSDRDCKNLEKSLTSFGFKVKVYNGNLTDSEVIAKLDEAAKADHSDADCLLVVYMSHGEKDHVETFNKKLMISDITDKFRGAECKGLAGKPKIFIWQACRGSVFDQPVDHIEESALEAGSVNAFPAGADFIMCYAVAEGYFAHRHKDKGSWYIKELCKQLENYGDSLEFTELLTLVNKNVSERKGKGETVKGKMSKQIPCFASMLTKELYLKKSSTKYDN
ncbi:caspase-6-like [Betta splendens]|uniref:Caspase-6 n=1 Tax=Betta splendens TaxID=158456 RepID=A0A6P7NF65_BETSP|nr:caspase-6-like [Betta splendens]